MREGKGKGSWVTWVLSSQGVKTNELPKGVARHGDCGLGGARLNAHSDAPRDAGRSARRQERQTDLIVHVSFASSPARETLGVSGPVVHQLVQVICERALLAGRDGRRLHVGGLAAHGSPDRVCAAGP